MHYTMDNAGPHGAIFLLAVVVVQRPEVVRCVQFYWTRGYFFKNRMTLAKKHSVWSKYVKIVDLK